MALLNNDFLMIYYINNQKRDAFLLLHSGNLDTTVRKVFLRLVDDVLLVLITDLFYLKV